MSGSIASTATPKKRARSTMRYRRAFAGPAVLAALLACAGCGWPAPEAELEAAARGVPAGLPTDDGAGIVVWESNRSGAWRLWRSGLRGGGLAQFSPDAPRQRHCCPHISPDGRRVAFLSLPAGRARYLDEAALGELWLAPTAGGPARRLVEQARTYFEHRAAVWRSASELHYIAVDGSVRRLDVDSGRESTLLEAQGNLARRWLVDASGRWAASGRGALAPVEKGRLGSETLLPGCQPYFSHDGAWGLWTAGAGGPIDRFELASGIASTMLEKNDRRTPAGRGYLYFPMLSRDATLLAWAASGGEHDHHRADYDLFLAELDPASLELVGDPWPVAPHPAVDRFPDLWRRPLAWDRLVGEVPLAVSLASPDGEVWNWRLDGRETAASRLEATLERPGTYPVVATAGERSLYGAIVALAPRPPPVWSAGWPARRAGVLWLWSRTTGQATTKLERRRGSVDIGRALSLADGSITAADTAALLGPGLQRTNRLGLEVMMSVPDSDPADGLAAIVAVGRSASRENFVLGQRGDRLVLRMRVGSKGRGAYDESDLGPLAPGQRLHLALSYTPGRLTVYRDGQQTLATTYLLGHLFHWRPYALTLGYRSSGAAAWSGTLEA
ncbi:MAG: hypothetical protein O7A98_09190, partial [Acidobacteria bacterium]|nr:hypothetical protein [Acidobacteriota bacterium]